MEVRYKRRRSEECIFENIFQNEESGTLLSRMQPETLKLSNWFKIREYFDSTCWEERRQYIGPMA
jgi:hypothetical protein